MLVFLESMLGVQPKCVAASAEEMTVMFPLERLELWFVMKVRPCSISGLKSRCRFISPPIRHGLISLVVKVGSTLNLISFGLQFVVLNLFK